MAKNTQMPPPMLTDQLRALLRQSIDASEFTRRHICRAAGIEESSLCRFLAGNSRLSAPAIDRLADVLRIDIVRRDEAPAKPTKRPKRKRSKRSLPTLDTSGLKAWPG